MSTGTVMRTEDSELERSDRVTSLCPGDAVCGNAAATDTTNTAAVTSAAAIEGGECVHVEEDLEQQSVHDTPRSQRCPAPQSSSM